MSNTRGNGDAGSAVPIGLEGPDPTVPLAEDTTWEALSDAAELLAAAGEEQADEDDLLVRDARAALAAGDRARADALECARALHFERRGRGDDALAAWRTAFDRGPELLVACWGLRRALEARAAWDELLGVFERRLGALVQGDAGRGSADVAALTEARGDLWLVHGRTLEDRLNRDDEAARSYRTGLIEAPGHTSLLYSLLLLGWRHADAAMTVEALTGFLRLALPGDARASLTAAVARIDRGAAGPSSPGQTVDPVAATRALETLRGALGAVEAAHWGPLLDELWVLAHRTAEPLARVEILRELVSRLPAEPADVVVGLLRERARLLRDQLGDKRAAAETLRQALKLQPTRASVVTDLADLIEDTGADVAGEGGARVADRLAELLATTATAASGADRSGPLDTGLSRALALRYLVALGREGRAAEGLAFLGRHPEMESPGADLRIVQMALRALTGDRAGLIAGFDAEATEVPGPETEVSEAARHAAARAHVVAGTLRERGGGEGADTAALASYRQAVALVPHDEIAGEALERHLRATRNWTALAERWQAGLAAKESAAGPADPVGSSPVRPSPSVPTRLLEELVAVTRDELGDLEAARRWQERLTAIDDDARAYLRHLELELAGVPDLAAPLPSGAAVALRALGDRAGTADVQTALHVEAGLALAAQGNRDEADELLRATLGADPSGRAAAGLEKLHDGDPEARVDVVRIELARVAADDTAGDRTRALRFRIAHHLVTAGRAGEALELLEPMRADGDVVAAALAWEIARRSGDPARARAVLDASGAAAGADLRVATDSGDARMAAGELPAAVEDYRAALRGQPSADAALGLLRAGALLGDPTVVMEASAALEPFADDETRVHLTHDAALLGSLVPSAQTAVTAMAGAEGEDEATAMLAWTAAMESGDVVSASAGLLAVARVMRDPAAVVERNAVLGRAAARARMGGAALSGAVHDQVLALSNGAAPIEVGLSDLPVAGRPDRASARATRAATSGGRLGYALDIERAVDAETRGDLAASLAAYLRAAERDSAGLEALEGIRRVAMATGNRLAAARAGMRLGTVLRTPRRAAVEFRRAAAIWQEEGLRAEAKVAAWQALAREPASDAVFEFLNGVLVEDGDHEGLERLLSLKLGVVADARSRVPLWLERANNRLDHLGLADAAIHDFKRILKVAPEHPAALRALAALATRRGYLPQAIDYLRPLLAIERDGLRRRDLMLELARAYEALRDGPRALGLVKEAIAVRPADDVAREELVDLLLRSGDWSGARAALETWQAGLTSPASAAKRAAIWLRVGALLRDRGRDRRGAEGAFARAAALDPLGDGVFQLAGLHARFDDQPAQRTVLDAAIADARRALLNHPFDVPLLRRLRDLYTARATGTDVTDVSAQGVAAAGQILSLLGVSEAALSGRLAPLRGTAPPSLTTSGGLAAGVLSRLRVPGAEGFVAEIWAKIAHTAAEMFEAAPGKTPARDRMNSGTEPRLAWIEAAATAVGLPSLALMMSKRGEAPDDSVVAIDADEPTLVVGRAALTASAAVRFRVGRALALLREHAVMFETRAPDELTTLFAAAAVTAGAGASGGRPRAEVAGAAKHMQRLMGRKERKALELEASRFGFETVDGAAFQAAVLATADRLGLLLAGSAEAAVRDICASPAPAPAEIAANPRAVALLRFALSEDYLALRRDADEGRG